MEAPDILITSGDPNGIGIEILLKALYQNPISRKIALIGKKEIVEYYAKKLDLPLPYMEIIEIKSNFSINPGKVERVNGEFSAKCIEESVSLLNKGYGKALITLPICKENLHLSGYHFEGHTDFLKHLTNSKKTMMFFYSPSFSVALHTVHIPLRDVFKHIKEGELISSIEFVYSESKKVLNLKKPEIFVCGLNPHAGENGHIGKEDFQIKNVVNKLKEMSIPVKGVFPSDTLFANLKENPEQIVYAMYHDQGLIGIKTKHPKKSINITLGLPFLRLSVTHGTAFDIAGKGIADYNNLRYVLETAEKLIGRA